MKCPKSVPYTGVFVVRYWEARRTRRATANPQLASGLDSFRTRSREPAHNRIRGIELEARKHGDRTFSEWRDPHSNREHHDS